MLPVIQVKERSYSVSIEKHKRNISHYSYKIVEKLQHQEHKYTNLTTQKEIKASLIVVIRDVEAFRKDLMENLKYQQFLKYKDFLNEKQIDQFFTYIRNYIINSTYEHHYCTFQLNGKKIDLENADSGTIHEVVQEFLTRSQYEEYNFIVGGDFQLVHKSPFRQVLYISKVRLGHMQQQDHKYKRYKTSIQQVETNELDHRLQQIGMNKKNKEIKQYLQQKNSELFHRSPKSKELQIKQLKNSPRDKKSDLQFELPQICDQIFEKFKRIFNIEQLNVDREIFSQFLLLCELSIFYSKNLTLQQQISRLDDDNEKFRLLTNNVLYFEFKVLKNMNNSLQALNIGTIQALLKFINQDVKQSLSRIYWNGFLRLKTFYIDRNWTTSDSRYFLLLLNEESPLTVQNYLQLPLREISKTILTMSEELLEQVVWQILQF